MAYDLVTWAPRIGATGDDVYNLPGATKIDGTKDTGAPTRIEAGSASFSTIPTIAEINASSHWNQVIALTNRRIRQYNAAFGTTMTPLSYISSNDRITATVINSIISAIGTLRLTEGFVEVPTINAASGLIKGDTLAQARKALAISGTLMLGYDAGTGFSIRPQDKKYQYTRLDNPYGTFSSGSFTASGAATRYGKYAPVPPAIERDRSLYSVAIPAWLSSASSASFQHAYTVFGSEASWSAELWYSNTDDSALPAGCESHFDNFVGNLVVNPVTDDTTYGNALSVSLAAIYARAGGYMSFLLATSTERTGTGATTSAFLANNCRFFITI